MSGFLVQIPAQQCKAKYLDLLRKLLKGRIKTNLI